MTSTGDWGEVIDDVEAKRFVGREQELNIFRQQISLDKPNYLIFYITGQGGVGKTTLLSRYRGIAKDAGFLLADCDEQERDVPSVLGRFAYQLAAQGFPLKRFDERYKTYRQKMNEIENDPDAPQGLAAMLGRTVVRAAFVVGDMVPGLRKGLEIIPQEELETQASEWTSYLAKKLTNKDELALVREPRPILTSLFFDDLNELARKQHILLCFENFEVAQRELHDWLLHLREYRPSLNIRAAIAGRNQPGPGWDTLRNVTMTIRLDVFTEKEAHAFLDASGITNKKRRIEILECSGRLPVIMSWLAATDGNEPDTSLPAQSIVERFLRWINEPDLRQVALLAAMPRVFNLDILTPLLDHQSQTTEVQSAFDWLLTMPFVRQGADGWRYHDVVRGMMLYYQRQKSPQAYRRFHTVLADFYNAKRDELYCSEEEQWINEQWRKNTLAYIYHFLAADSTQHWMSVISLFAVAVRKRRSLAVEMIELLSTGDVQNELSHEQRSTVQLFRQQLQAIKDKDLLSGFEMFDRLCSMVGLSPQAKGCVLTYRGECYRLKGEWDKALRDFGDALHFIPGDVRTFTRRGVTYVLMERYQEALADLDQAIGLSEEDTWALAIRGETYRRMKQYQEALNDLDRAIALDEKNAWALAVRGETYRRVKRYQEALADLDRAITLDDKDAWALAVRGETYRRMKRYQETLTDLDRVIALDEKNTWALAIRGEAFLQLKRYQEALTDLDRAIALDEKNTWALAVRGETYYQMGRYQEALADLDGVVALGGRDVWVIINRGETYYKMGRYQEASVDLSSAIALNEKYARTLASQELMHLLPERNRGASAIAEQGGVPDEKNVIDVTVVVSPPSIPPMQPPSYSPPYASSPPIPYLSPGQPYGNLYRSPQTPQPPIPYPQTPDYSSSPSGESVQPYAGPTPGSPNLYRSQAPGYKPPDTPMPPMPSMPSMRMTSPVRRRPSHLSVGLLLLILVILVLTVVVALGVFHLHP